MYSVAVDGSTKSTNRTLKKNHAKKAMVNGLINQLTVKVNINPFGLLPTSLIEEKSICDIIGYTITQIQMAITIFT
jgi:hypothetical protein